jgi:hypothetical protein
MSTNTFFTVHLNTTRTGLDSLTPERRIDEVRRSVKMFILPRQPEGMMLDSMVPDHLVTQAMVERFLALTPPIASVIPEYQDIINEIEYTYVVGMFFSTVSASCVSTERLLNQARIELHRYHPKIKELWGKGPSNAWAENIEALQTWGYIDDEFGQELKALYTEVRCRYLHSGPINDLRADALRSARAAYRLLGIFLGFPEDLFRFTSRIECLNNQDPRFVAFYKPHLRTEPLVASSDAGSLTGG